MRNWIPSPPIHYHLGVDGISLFLVLLTTFLTPMAMLASWKSIDQRVQGFFISLLVLETGMIGVFLSLDLVLFFLFWEAMLIPMYFLIGIWGHERRIYAALKFIMYTMLGSILMFVAMVWLYELSGTFDLPRIQAMLTTGQLTLPLRTELLLFGAFFLAFAIKVPLFPLHTWLPDAHTEAPTAGSVVLAGVLLKMGTYGMVRFCVPLFPEAAHRLAPYVAVLAIIGILYGALVAMVQTDLKRLVAYSSVSHLGFVVLGIFAFTPTALQGALYQMLNHGISTGALFVLVGTLYDRRHTHLISEYGGLATPMPVLASLFLFVSLSSAGLPMLNGFVGEFLILAGTFERHAAWASWAALGVIFSAIYLLWAYQRVFFGDITQERNRDTARRRYARALRPLGHGRVDPVDGHRLGVLHAPHRILRAQRHRPDAASSALQRAFGGCARSLALSKRGPAKCFPRARTFCGWRPSWCSAFSAFCSCWSSRFSRTRGAAFSFSSRPPAPRWPWLRRSFRRCIPARRSQACSASTPSASSCTWWSGWWPAGRAGLGRLSGSRKSPARANTTRWSCLPRRAWA